MFGKNKLAAIAAEFLGTMMLCLVVFSVSSSISIAFFPAIAAGLTLGILVLTIGSISGAHVNPAVTISLWSRRKIDTGTGIVYIATQMLAGLISWRVIEYLLDTPTPHIAGWGLNPRVLIAEALGTFIFTFGIAAVIQKNYEGSQKAAVIGASLTLGIFVAAIASNGVLNPAVAVALNSISWAYIVGPILGGLLGINLYPLLFSPSETKKVAAARTSKRKK